MGATGRLIDIAGPGKKKVRVCAFGRVDVQIVVGGLTLQT